jgi:hypothetical protein
MQEADGFKNTAPDSGAGLRKPLHDPALQPREKTDEAEESEATGIRLN